MYDHPITLELDETRVNLGKAKELLEDMLGLDKGPTEDEYIEWERKVRKFLGF